MGYSVAVTQAGQITIPKLYRDKFGFGKRVSVEEADGVVIVRKEKTLDELMKELELKREEVLSANDKERIAKNAGATYKKSVEELEKTAEGRKVIESEYGEGIYGY